MDKPEFKVHGGEVLVVLGITIVFLLASFVYKVGGVGAPVSTAPAMTQDSATSTAIVIPDDQNPYFKTTLTAKSVLVYDMRDQKVLFEKNADDSLPLASLTKVMTADLVSDLLPANARIAISKELAKEDSDPQLAQNETWTLQNLIDYTLTISSNDGAVSLAAAVGNFGSTTINRASFVDQMNTQAEKIGLTNTHFYNESGLDQDTTNAGAYGSARDMSKLFQYTLQTHPDILVATRYAKFNVSSSDNTKHIAVNTDTAIPQIPGIIASKTGYTDLAGGNLIIAYDASVGHPIIAVVLGSTYTGRFDDILELVHATNAYLSLQNGEPAV